MTHPPRVSFEFFPPKNLDGAFHLSETVKMLAPFNPEFVSVTYGAAGGTRDLTHQAVTAIGEHYGLKVAAHLTCVNATKSDTLQIAQSYHDAGVREIVALRGDAPKGQARFIPTPKGFANSIELIAALAETGHFELRVAAYPETHPDARSAKDDLLWLKAKIDAGASSAITQFFFTPEVFLRFRDKAVAAGINAPIIPGIMPIENWAGLKAFAKRSDTFIPPDIDAAFSAAIRDGRADLLSLALCTELCDQLQREGVEDLHFYTLNRPHLTRDTCLALGLRSQTGLQMVA
ncbi:MAG: methylenetetrahydrofolate reductase [NAD(P)H] [Paracoccaceae bacterium]